MFQYIPAFHRIPVCSCELQRFPSCSRMFQCGLPCLLARLVGSRSHSPLVDWKVLVDYMVLFERLPSLKLKRQPTGRTQLYSPRLRRRLQRAIFSVVRRLYRVLPTHYLAYLRAHTAMGSRFTGRPHSGNHLRITPMCSVNSSHSLSSFSHSPSYSRSYSLSYSRSYPRIRFKLRSSKLRSINDSWPLLRRLITAMHSHHQARRHFCSQIRCW